MLFFSVCQNGPVLPGISSLRNISVIYMLCFICEGGFGGGGGLLLAQQGPHIKNKIFFREMEQAATQINWYLRVTLLHNLTHAVNTCFFCFFSDLPTIP